MPLLVWIALWFSLGLLLVSLTLGAVYCFRAGRALWRDARSFTVALDGVIVALTDSLAAMAQRSAAAATAAPRLDAAIARLRVSSRRWSVLLAAVGDVRASVVALYPRK
jgi:hypothetical protein